MQSDLLTVTKDLLVNCDLPLPQIAKSAGVGYEWLKKFASGDIPNPGIMHVQKLHAFLAGEGRAH